MRALVYRGAQSVQFEEFADPIPGVGEVLVKVRAAGICGSDMHAYLGHDPRRQPPMILGHEAAGHAVGGAWDGQAVVINPLVTCGRCPRCLEGRENVCAQRQIISLPPRQGSLAEQVAIPERNLVPLPRGLDPVRAVLAEPLAVAWHAVLAGQRLSHRPLAEGRSLIIGGGAIGLGTALVLRAQGCTDITILESNPLRRETVAAAGDFRVMAAPDQMAEQAAYSLVVDAVGAVATRELASDVVAGGGVIVHVGIQEGGPGLEMRRLTLQEVSVTGTYAYTMTDFQAAVRAMGSGVLGPLDWYESRPMADGAGAFQDLMAGRAAAAKIVLLN